MDIRNYLSFLWRVKFKALAVGLIFAVCGGLYTHMNTEPTFEGVLFLSVGMEQEVYPNNAEAFGARGVTEADYYFAQTVQGWTMDPSFGLQVNERLDEVVSVTARQQERQNIIFSITASSMELVEEGSDAVLAELEQRLESYNDTMNTSYQVANPELTVWLNDFDVVRNVVTSFVFGLIFMILMILFYEYAIGVVSFPGQVEVIFGKGSVNPAFLEKKGSILGLGCEVKDKHGRELVKLDQVKGKDLFVVVGVGSAKVASLEAVRRLAGDVEWTT